MGFQYFHGPTIWENMFGSLFPSASDQWLNFQLFGIAYLVGKIKFKLLVQGPLAK